jgi:hypothetical protein
MSWSAIAVTIAEMAKATTQARQRYAVLRMNRLALRCLRFFGAV